MPADHRGWISFILAIMSLNKFKMSEDTFWTSRWGEGVRLFPCSTSLNFACERNRRWDVLSWKRNYSKLNLYHNNKRFRLEPPPLPPLCRGCNQPVLDEVEIRSSQRQTTSFSLYACTYSFSSWMVSIVKWQFWSRCLVIFCMSCICRNQLNCF